MQFKFSYREPLISQNLWSGMVLKCIFFFLLFFSLYKQELRYRVFIKEMFNWRAHLRLFSSNDDRKIRMKFYFFTFASQWKLNCLAMVNIIISLFPSFVVWKQLLSVHRFNSLVVFLMSNKVHPNHFSAVGKNIDRSNRIFKTLKMYIWINFSLRIPCWAIDYERAQNWKITRSFYAKVLLRITSIKLFVLWQVLKPPIRKAIFNFI